LKLKIADDLKLPLDAATQTFAFIARKGAGKTYAAGKLVELLLDAHVQVVVLDTVGNWYGLRLAADGKSPGYDIPVLGGLRGDIPLEAAGGALIADIVVDTGRSLVLDASQWNKADRQRFAAAFGERLWLRKKGERHPSPVMLVIEESQLIVPQDVRGDTATMVGIFEEIIRLGRNYGIGVAMITQRPQSVNKEVLNQTECLFVGQVNGSQERDALKKWITHQGMDVHLVDELPRLKVGTFYVWSPQWLNLLQQVQILPKHTYDASATPKVGDKRVQRDLKPLDLTELQEQMAATIAKAKADDPRELRKQVADLKAQAADAQRAVAVAQQRVEAAQAQAATVKDQKVVPIAVKKELTQARRALEEAMKFVVKVQAIDFAAQDTAVLEQAVTKAVTGIVAAFEARLEKQLARVEGLKTVAGAAEKAIKAALASDVDLTVQVQKREPFAVATPTPARPVVRQPPAPRADGETGLPPSKQKVLDALAWLEQIGIAQADRRQVAFLARVSPVSSTYENNVSALRTAGYLDYPSSGVLMLTDAGRAIADGGGAPVTTEELHAAIRAKLPPSKWKLVQAAIDAHPQELTRDELADRAGVSAGSSTFENNVSALRTLGVIDYPRKGSVVATKILFLDRYL
jgi:hypothetical protein